jgi:hypothetical protein
VLRSISLVILCSFHFFIARADTTRGRIEGAVSGPDGNPVAGADAILESPLLAAGRIVQSTGGEGRFRFDRLPPGEYSVSVAAAGFETRRATVSVNADRTTTLAVSLALPGIAETVTVLASVSLVDPTTPALSTHFPHRAVQALPVRREFIEFMDLVPAVNDRGAYGEGGIVEDKYAKGSATSAYRLNGVDVSNVDRGSTWVNPSFDIIEEVQITGVGASAEYGNFLGATVNVVTRSGSADFHGGASWFYEDSSFRGDNSSGAIDLARGDLEYFHDASLSFGGPLLRDRLFFFTNYAHRRSSEALAESPLYDDLRQNLFHGRVDLRLNPANDLSVLFNTDPARDENLGLTTADGPEIAFSERFRTHTWHLKWGSVLSSDTSVEVKYAGFDGAREIEPVSGPETPRIRDVTNQRTYLSSGRYGKETNHRHEIVGTLSRYAADFLGAGHDFKFGVEIEDGGATRLQRNTGNVAFFTYDYGDSLYVYSYTRYGINTDAEVGRASAFVQDALRILECVTVNAGLRYDHVSMSDGRSGDALVSWNLFAPRIGVAIDPAGDGSSVLRAHFGRYYDKLTTAGLTRFASAGFEGFDTYVFLLPRSTDFRDPAPFLAGLVEENLVGSRGDDPFRIPVDPDLTGPRTDVWNVGFEKELGRVYAIAVDYVHKSDAGFLAREDRAPHTYAPFTFEIPELQTTMELQDRTDTNPEDLVITNPAYYKRRHDIVTLSLRRRPDRRFSAAASLTYQDSSGTTGNDAFVANGLGNPSEHTDPNRSGPFYRGRLSYDRSWQLKSYGALQLPADVLLSFDLRLLAGRPWESTVSSGNIPELRGQGFYNLFAEKRGSRRFDGSRILNLRVGKGFALGSLLGQEARLEVVADLFAVPGVSPLRGRSGASTNEAGPRKQSYG